MISLSQFDIFNTYHSKQYVVNTSHPFKKTSPYKLENYQLSWIYKIEELITKYSTLNVLLKNLKLAAKHVVFTEILFVKWS